MKHHERMPDPNVALANLFHYIFRELASLVFIYLVYVRTNDFRKKLSRQLTSGITKKSSMNECTLTVEGYFCTVQATELFTFCVIKSMFISVLFMMSAIIRGEIGFFQFNPCRVLVISINIVKSRIFGFLKVYCGCVPTFIFTKKSCKMF